MTVGLFKVSPCGGGVNKDLLPSELAPGAWSDALNMRFPNGFAERRRGVREAFTTPSVIPYAIETYQTATTRFLVRVGLAKVHVDDGTTVTEITRYTDGKVISSITRVGTTATLTTSTAHGLSTGNTVSVFGAVPTGYNVTGAITVTGANTFTYTMAADPGSSATTVGQYSYNVQADFTGDADDRVSLFVFNGVLILNHPVDGPYYWGGDTTIRLRRLPGWPVGQVAHAMRPFKNYLIALKPTISSVIYPHLILWSINAEAGAVPTTWTALSTNDAGDTPQSAETGGHIVDGLALGDSFIVYKDDSRFAMDFIGGNSVFRVYRLPGNDGLLSRGCVVATPKGHVFLTNGDVKIHTGGEAQSIADGVLRKFLFALMDTLYAPRSFLVTNQPQCEVWVCFPGYAQAAAGWVYAWNWNDNTWGIFNIGLFTCACSGQVPPGIGDGAWDVDTETWDVDPTRWVEDEYNPNEQRLIVATTTPKIGLADTGTQDFGVSFTSRLERTGMNTGDSDSMKTPRGVRLHVDSMPSIDLSVYVGNAKTAAAAPTYAAVATFTVGASQDWANRIAPAGRYPAVKIETTEDRVWKLRSYEIDFAKGGRK